MKIQSIKIYNNFKYSNAFSTPKIKESTQAKNIDFANYNLQNLQPYFNIHFKGLEPENNSDLKFEPITPTRPVYKPSLEYDDIKTFSSSFVEKIETQLMNPTVEDIEKLIQSIKRKTKAPDELIKEVLYRLTQFSSYDSLKIIEDEVKKRQLNFVDNFKNITLNEVLYYLGNRKFYITSGLSVKKAVFLDDMLLTAAEKTKENSSGITDYQIFSQLISEDSDIYLLDGFDIKASNGKYYSASFLSGCGYLKSLAIDVIKQVQSGKDLDEVLNGDLKNRTLKLFPNIKRKIQVLKKHIPSNISAEDIQKNIRTRNIESKDVQNSINKIISQHPMSKARTEIYKNALMKYLDNFCMVFSPQSLGLKVKKLYEKIEALEQKTGKEIAFCIPVSQKSNSLITYMYKKNNPNDKRRIDLHEPYDNDDISVIFDDISISGGSFVNYCSIFLRKLGLDNFLQKKLYFCPIVLSPHNKDLFSNTKIISLNKTPPTDDIFSKKNNNLSTLFEIFNKEELEIIHKHLKKGYNNGINAVIFPYMIPDNSPEFIGVLFAKFLYKSTVSSNKTKQTLLYFNN